MPKKVIGGKVEKRIPVEGIGGVFLYANDAKSLSNWYAHHFGLKLETYEDGKVYGTEFKYRRLGDSSKVDSTVFSISQANDCNTSLCSGVRSSEDTSLPKE